MGNYEQRDSKTRRNNKKEKITKPNICSNKFSQDIIIEFDVVFEVEILDADIVDVTLVDDNFS
ncbi:MAG: hypothetical protein ACOCRB_01445 [Halanaerobiaceae bacterium]